MNRFTVFSALAFTLVVCLFVLPACDSTGSNADNGSNEETSSAPAAPSDLRAEPGNATVDLTWDAVDASDLDGYNVYRSTSSISFGDISDRSPLNESPLSDTTYTDDDVENRTTYYYAVTAVDQDGNESDASANVETTPIAGVGSSIVYEADPDGTFNLYAIEPDGATRTMITDFEPSVSPAWRPDSTRLAFVSSRNSDRNKEIYTVRPTSADNAYYDGDLKRLTDNSSVDFAPAWAPDGSRIAFHSDRDGDNEIYTMNPDGSDVQQVTDNASSDRAPAWAPDGSRIAFQSNRDGDAEIYTANPDGSNVQQVTDDDSTDRAPAWKPAGSRIAFDSDRDGEGEIYTINPDGSGLQSVTADTAAARFPSWSPTGSRLVYQSDRDGDNELYTVKPDGSDRIQVTDNQTEDQRPAW